MGPVLELDVEIAPDHGPEGVVVPRAHEVENGAVLAHGGAEFIHLDPVEGFFFCIVEGDEALGVVVAPPSVVAGKEGVGLEVLLRFFDAVGANFEAVFLWEGVVHGGNQSLLGGGVSADVPAGGGFTAVLVEDLLAGVGAIGRTLPCELSAGDSPSRFGWHRVGGFSECFPARGAASSIEGGSGG